MKITSINYSQSKETIYGYGLKRWDKAGVEIELENGEQPDKAFELAKQLVNEQLDITINQVEPEPPKEIQVKKVTDEIQAILDGIYACTEIEGTGELSLNTFWLRAKGNLATLNAYKAKEKQLKDAEKLCDWVNNEPSFPPLQNQPKND